MASRPIGRAMIRTWSSEPDAPAHNCDDVREHLQFPNITVGDRQRCARNGKTVSMASGADDDVVVPEFAPLASERAFRLVNCAAPTDLLKQRNTVRHEEFALVFHRLDCGHRLVDSAKTAGKSTSARLPEARSPQTRNIAA